MQEKVQRYSRGSYKFVEHTKEDGSYMQKFYNENVRNSKLFGGLRIANVMVEVISILWFLWHFGEMMSAVIRARTFLIDDIRYILVYWIVPAGVLLFSMTIEDTIWNKESESQRNVVKAQSIMALSDWLRGKDLSTFDMTVREETYNSYLNEIKVGFTDPETKECRDVILSCIIDSKVSSPSVDMCKGTITLKTISPHKAEVKDGEGNQK